MAEDTPLKEDNIKDGGLCLNTVLNDEGNVIGYEIRVWKGLFKGVMNGEIDVLYIQEREEAVDVYNEMLEAGKAVYGYLENIHAVYLLLYVEEYGDLIKKQTVETSRIGLYKSKKWK